MRVLVTPPVPRHSGHFSSTMVPTPWHSRHGSEKLNDALVAGDQPGAVALRAGARLRCPAWRRCRGRCRRRPARAASAAASRPAPRRAKSSVTSASTSRPRGGPRGRRRPPPPPEKIEPNRSEKPAPPNRRSPAPPPPCRAAEPAEQVGRVEPPGRRRPGAPRRNAPEPNSERISSYSLRLLVVGQHVVRLGDGLEPLLGLGVARVVVGVQLPGQLAVRLLDLVGGGGLRTPSTA